jgi:hypothetical protein
VRRKSLHKARALASILSDLVEAKSGSRGQLTFFARNRTGCDYASDNAIGRRSAWKNVGRPGPRRCCNSSWNDDKTSETMSGSRAVILAAKNKRPPRWPLCDALCCEASYGVAKACQIAAALDADPIAFGVLATLIGREGSKGYARHRYRTRRPIQVRICLVGHSSLGRDAWWKSFPVRKATKRLSRKRRCADGHGSIFQDHESYPRCEVD